MAVTHAKPKDISECLDSITDNELCVIFCVDATKRRMIYEYLDDKFPKLGRIGVISGRPEGDAYFLLKECWHCDERNIKLDHFSPADESTDSYPEYWTWCPKCDNNISWIDGEDGDSCVIRVERNNSIVVGHDCHIMVKKYPKHDTVISKSQFDEIASTFVRIKAPPVAYTKTKKLRRMSKSELEEHIKNV